MGLTTDYIDFFSVAIGHTEYAVYKYFVAAEIVLHQSRDLQIIQRTVFNFWNALSEIGGLYGVLYGICYYLNSVAVHNKTDNFVSAMLYQPPDEFKTKKQLTQSGLNTMKELQLERQGKSGRSLIKELL